ncbi:MAG: hypothetical protein NTW03_05605 [Verrucomicrobia bacterium]|nr:hypothetical protein [Verrucomicrobiota bacterium]
MNHTVKAILYAVLLTAACLLGVKFQRAYKTVMKAGPPELVGESRESAPAAPAKVSTTSTNLAGTANLPLASNAVMITNAVRLTNEVVLTNLPSSTNGAASTNPPTSGKNKKPRGPKTVSLVSTNAAAEDLIAGAHLPSLSTLMSYGVGLFFVAVCLSLLAAHDFSHFVADRFEKLAFDDEGEGCKAPEYERAEQVWVDGDHLEAVRLMRDFLQRHPRKVHVAVRIAEIYEKDLGNYLAAALEYEEVLKHHLRAEQWAWFAIHLANLYSGKLDQTAKAVALLQRITSEYAETAAATKARFRLSQLEGEGEKNVVEAPIRVEIPQPPAPAPAPASNLPRGFRPKK